MASASAVIARLNYYWRLITTGGCFAAFGIGGLFLTSFVFPVLLLTPRKTRAVHARWLIHKAFGLFIWTLQALGVMRFEVVGAEKLRHCQNTLILANHPTLIDVVALISLLPVASCVVKRALWNNLFLGGVVRAAGYISNAHAENLIDDCANDLATGNPLIIFPEGTRTQPGEPLRFLRGAAYIALKSGMPILPVLIHCTPSTLSKRDKWHRIPAQRFHLRLEILNPVSTKRWVASDEPQSIAARKLTQALAAYFTQELAAHEPSANA